MRSENEPVGTRRVHVARPGTDAKVPIADNSCHIAAREAAGFKRRVKVSQFALGEQRDQEVVALSLVARKRERVHGSIVTFGTRISRANKRAAFLYRFGRVVCMDLNIKDLDNDVGERLRQQAAAAGLSMQQYLRNQLTRIASRPSPAELAPGAHTMSRSDFEAVRAKLRDIDAA